MKIAVIGDGGWGTANALLLAGYGHEVTLWGAFPDYIAEMRRTRQKYLNCREILWQKNMLSLQENLTQVILRMQFRF